MSAGDFGADSLCSHSSSHLSRTHDVAHVPVSRSTFAQPVTWCQSYSSVSTQFAGISSSATGDMQHRSAVEEDLAGSGFGRPWFFPG